MRLLLVEDSVALADELLPRLRQAGYAVDWLADGRDASRRASDENYDLAVLDIGLPGRNGLEVLHDWRAAGLPLPVLVLTARDSFADRIAGLRAGADDYLAKPFHPDELLLRLQALLRRGAPLRLKVLRLGPMTLDPATHQVHRDSEPLTLSAKQFAILWYLLRHRGQVVTRSMLLSSVWGYSFDPGTNLVDVHIAQLRRRLERPGQPCLIHTIRGVGYRVSDDEPAA